jgi:hypothetical protein
MSRKTVGVALLFALSGSAVACSNQQGARGACLAAATSNKMARAYLLCADSGYDACPEREAIRDAFEKEANACPR